MAGLFAQSQPDYAGRGIATFPLDGTSKKPVVRCPARIGLPYSHELARKFADHDAFGLWAGRCSGLTVLDVDASDDSVLTDRLDRHGHTPIIVRTKSGHFHAWYSHAGEKRTIRHRGEPVDILGSGLIVAPPSRFLQGSYQFIQGGLDDLPNLPVMLGLDARAYQWVRSANGQSSPNVDIKQKATKGALEKPWDQMRDGDGRHNRLLDRIQREAHAVDTFGQLFDVAETQNADFAEPLPSDEVANLSGWVWKKQEAGQNWKGRGGVVALPNELVDKLAAAEPHAYALLSILRRRQEFFLANSMASSMGWTKNRFRAARDALVKYGCIRCVHLGGRGPHDPPVYGWATKGSKI